MANIDRRVARTRAAMRNALIHLLRRKPYGEITVQEILDEADIGRSTFYAHCSGKDQLIRLSFGLLRSELEKAGEGTATDTPRLLPFSLPVLQHLAYHRDLYGAFADERGSELLFGELRLLVLDLVRGDLKRFPANDIPSAVSLQFIAGAFTALAGWWLNGKVVLPPAELDALFQKLVRNGFESSATNS